LLDRRGERAVVDRVLGRAGAGNSAVLVVRGEPGIGKTVLLDYARRRASASGVRVVRAWGVESEMELAFAGLHQLCVPLLGRLVGLPKPQGDALRVAFGMREGTAPDRFMVGLAALSLLAASAEDQPLACMVDDAQWLDRASLQCIAFAARRLLAEPIALIFAVREPGVDEELAGLPALTVPGLGHDDSRTLLATAIRGRVDAEVRDRIVAETGGNPLALLQLPRGLGPAELAGGFWLPDPRPLTSRIESSFYRQYQSLPRQTQRLLLTAAADPTGDVTLLWRAAEIQGISPDLSAAAAEGAGLIELGARVQFGHPLARSAVYQAASAGDRQAAHRALAEATDPKADADRRAWHLAHAAAEPDEEVAAELESSAGRAQARGGLAAAAAFLERAAALTPEPAQRVTRALAAAQAKIQAGAFDAAVMLLGMAESGPLDELQRARVDLLRAQLAFAASQGSDAPPLLLKAAKRLESIDVDLAHATYLDAMMAALFACRLAGPDGDMEQIARAASAAPPPPHAPSAPDLLLAGLAAHFSEGYAAGAPILQRALSAFDEQMSAEEEFRGLSLAFTAAMYIWDADRAAMLSNRYVHLTREAGALSELPLALSQHAYVLFLAGELDAAGSVVEEVQVATEATGSTFEPYSAMSLAALRGSEAEASVLIEAIIKDVRLRGEGIGITVAEWSNAVLNNGLSRHEKALSAAERATENYDWELVFPSWGLVELIEAAARCGLPERAADAVRRLSESSSISGSDWGLGVAARSRALLTSGAAAEPLYVEAIERLGRTWIRAELGRAHLLYGEWLRRENRRTDASEQLRIAHEMLTAMGMDAFADRARRELLATGETVRKRTVETLAGLTTQEAQIAKLAREGRTNQEIGTQLFISPRTVEWHLGNVFTKLGITSRKGLR